MRFPHPPEKAIIHARYAYLTPDNRHVIFNSTVTGVAQAYAATVTAAFLDKLTLPKNEKPEPRP